MHMEEGLNKQSVGIVRKAGNGGGKRCRRKIVNSDSSSTERELYYPDLNEYKKLDLAIEKRRIMRGSWSLQENKTYLHFLSKFRRDFISEQARRRSVVFNRLSKELHKRTPDQCRSHHQKLQNRFNNDIDRIIDFVQKKIKRKMAGHQAQGDRDEKCEKELKVTRTSDLSECQDGIVLNFQHLAEW